MKYLSKNLFLFFFILLVSSCSDNDDDNETNNPIEETEAIAIYNQAYQENFQEDSIDFIIANANNAYVLLDPFQENIPASIAAIKANGNEVGAYISIGTGEDFRADFGEMEPFLVTEPWDDWPGEFFVNQTTTGIIEIMKARIDQIADWGCDWVEFDNMDWVFDDEYRQEYGFEVTIAEGKAYYQELCDYVHSKGMKCMAKNMTEAAADFDGVLYESYNDEKNWWDVSGAQNFLNQGKLVIINHYNETNCGEVYSEYKGIYSNNISFICEDANLQKYVHYNEE